MKLLFCVFCAFGLLACDSGSGDGDDSSSSATESEPESTLAQQTSGGLAGAGTGDSDISGDEDSGLPEGDTTAFACSVPVVASGVFESGILSSGSVFVPISQPLAKTISVTVSGGGFTGSATKEFDGSELGLLVPLTFDGSGTGGTLAELLVNSAEVAGSCTLTAKILSTSESVLGLSAGEYSEDGSSGICAKKADNSIFCWGDTATFHGGAAVVGTPYEITGLPVGINEVLPLESNGFAQTTDGALYSWGKSDSSNKSLGRAGTSGSYNAPAAVSGWDSGLRVKKISGDHSEGCALLNDGQLWCWGRNLEGEFGVGDTDQSLTPIQSIESGVADVFAGGSVHCVQKFDGSVWCSGEGTEGQLGNGATVSSLEFVQVDGVQNVSFLAMTGNQNIRSICALQSSGSLKCWGKNDKGQVGNGTTINVSTPTEILTGISHVRAGNDHTCAVKETDGSVWCWGQNDKGQLGNGTLTDSAAPVQVDGLLGVTKVEVGEKHSCALTGAGDVWCWGRNTNGRLGDETNFTRTAPVRFGSGSNPSADDLRVYRHDTCMVSGSDVYCAGQHSGNTPRSILISF